MLTTSLLLSLNCYSNQDTNEWEFVVESDTGTKFYIDMNNITREGEFIFYWIFGNYITPVGNEYYSSLIQNKGNCQTLERIRLNATFYKELNGKGDTINLDESSINDEWETTELIKHTLRKICGS